VPRAAAAARASRRDGARCRASFDHNRGACCGHRWIISKSRRKIDSWQAIKTRKAALLAVGGRVVNRRRSENIRRITASCAPLRRANRRSVPYNVRTVLLHTAHHRGTLPRRAPQARASAWRQRQRFQHISMIK